MTRYMLYTGFIYFALAIGAILGAQAIDPYVLWHDILYVIAGVMLGGVAATAAAYKTWQKDNERPDVKDVSEDI